MNDLILLNLYRVSLRAEVKPIYDKLKSRDVDEQRARNTAAAVASQRSKGKHGPGVYRRELDEVLDRPMRRLMLQ